jgi:hypothetical protein
LVLFANTSSICTFSCAEVEHLLLFWELSFSVSVLVHIPHPKSPKLVYTYNNIYIYTHCIIEIYYLHILFVCIPIKATIQVCKSFSGHLPGSHRCRGSQCYADFGDGAVFLKENMNLEMVCFYQHIYVYTIIYLGKL